MGGSRASLGLALAVAVSVLGAPSVGATTQRHSSDGDVVAPLASRAATEMLPVESKVFFDRRDLAGLDQLYVVGATGYGHYGTNGPVTRICVWAKLSFNDRRSGIEGGCIEESDSAELVYRFDGVRWTATTAATFQTTTLTYKINARGKERLLEQGPPSSAKVDLRWKGVGQVRPGYWAYAFPCFVIPPICVGAGVEFTRDAELSGVVELDWLDIALKFPRKINGTMSWRKGR